MTASQKPGQKCQSHQMCQGAKFGMLTMYRSGALGNYWWTQSVSQPEHHCVAVDDQGWEEIQTISGIPLMYFSNCSYNFEKKPGGYRASPL